MILRSLLIVATPYGIRVPFDKFTLRRHVETRSNTSSEGSAHQLTHAHTQTQTHTRKHTPQQKAEEHSLHEVYRIHMTPYMHLLHVKKTMHKNKNLAIHVTNQGLTTFLHSRTHFNDEIL